jgi:hypothetical protein
MSWDIFVQELPAGAHSFDDIPEDFEPGPLMSREALIAGIRQVVPSAKFPDSSWASLEGPGYSIEVSIGDEDPVTSFAFHVSGGDLAPGVVADLLAHFGLRGLDSASDDGWISLLDMVGARGFEPPTSASRTLRASQTAPRPDRESAAAPGASGS